MIETKRDWPGLIVAVVFVGLGTWVYSVSNSFTEYAAIFPRTIAIVMMLVSAANMVVLIFGKGRPNSKPNAGYRPFGLIGVGALWATLIPLLGFLIASIFGFLGAMVLAKFSHWSNKDWVKFTAIGTLVVTVAYSLFKYVLNVPL
ncbi:tripartite tricarboxylate transporter TctB family protein [Halomonas sp. KAO]|uniref:tripartite tricarboxylate transporter TctB family protein n=1 Tax=Halomonas sp. KAO TaxID=2783858 RepID=UPI0018A02B59|nr:tripartite tricarboxylate transporter TctB family protein [Halomonas sp. KAO]MBF7053805.1 tripartite tricarboxylate transporter TctB family protein [Halomonas sp. KAO]